MYSCVVLSVMLSVVSITVNQCIDVFKILNCSFYSDTSLNVLQIIKCSESEIFW